MNSVTGHEITHILEGTEFYDILKQTVFDYAKSKNDYQGRYDSLVELYKDVKDADIEAELTADLVGDYLFTDTDFIKNLSTNHRNVFEKIYDEIKYLCKIATAGSKEARELERVKKAFEDAYRAETKNTTEGGVRYSLKIEHVDGTVEEIADLRNLTDEQSIQYLESARAFELLDETYIPIRKELPQVIIDSLLQEDIHLENRSLIMEVGKARRLMRQDINRGKGKRGHGLTPRQIVDIINDIENPIRIIYQTNRVDQNGKPLPNNVAIFVKYSKNGVNGFATVEFENPERTGVIGQEFGETNFYTVNTASFPDTTKNGKPFNYMKQLEDNPDNIVLEIKRRQSDDSANWKKHPSTTNELPYNNSIRNPIENVNQKDVFGFKVDENAAVNEDLLEELSIHHPEAEVDAQGKVTVYHRTSKENAEKIKQSGVMQAKEDALFFSSKESGYAFDYGDTVLKFKIPSTVLQVNDIFHGEVHFDVPLKYKNGTFSLDVSDYLIETDNSQEKAFSLSSANEDLAPVGDFQGEDMALETAETEQNVPKADDVAPVAEGATDSSVSHLSDARKAAEAKVAEEVNNAREFGIDLTFQKMLKQLESGGLAQGKDAFGRAFWIQKKSNGTYVAIVEGEGSGTVLNELNQECESFDEAYISIWEYLYEQSPDLYGDAIKNLAGDYDAAHGSTTDPAPIAESTVGVDTDQRLDYDNAKDILVYARYQPGKDIQEFDRKLWARKKADAIQKCGLTDEEVARLEDYVGGRAYNWNLALLGDPNNELTEHIKYLVDQTIGALRKFTMFTGRTYRNLSFANQNSLNSFLTKHTAGKNVVLDAFASASKDPNGYVVSGDYVVHMVIDGFSSRDISGSFAFPWQQEVVYLPATEIYISRITTANDGNPLIYAQEVTENGKNLETNRNGVWEDPSKPKRKGQAGDAKGKRDDLGRVYRDGRMDGDGGTRNARQIQQPGDSSRYGRIEGNDELGASYSVLEETDELAPIGNLDTPSENSIQQTPTAENAEGVFFDDPAPMPRGERNRALEEKGAEDIAPVAEQYEAINPNNSVGAAPYGFDPVTQLQYEYGTIPDGENPVRDDSLPKSTTGKDKVSLTARTVKGAKATPDELIDLLDKETVGGRFSYIPIKNSETVRKAYDEIVKKGWEAARGEWEARVRRSDESLTRRILLE